MERLSQNTEKGFTIVELIIYLALLLIVLNLAYMYFGYGLKVFDRGERKSIAQQSIRVAADFISSELRYADEVIINPNEIKTDDDYSYFYQIGDSVYYRNNKNSVIRTLLDSSADDNIAYRIVFSEQSFTGIADTKLVVTFKLETADEDLYELESNVYILNLNNPNNYEINSVDANSPYSIKFKHP